MDLGGLSRPWTHLFILTLIAGVVYGGRRAGKGLQGHPGILGRFTSLLRFRCCRCCRSCKRRHCKQRNGEYGEQSKLRYNDTVQDGGSSNEAEASVRIMESEQLARTEAFLGRNGITKIRTAYIVIVGVGGVGSHAAVALTRSGVGFFRLIDFDQLTLSSLNRHATATRKDVGWPKVEVLARALRKIAPWVQCEACIAQFTRGQAENLLLSPWGKVKNSSTLSGTAVFASSVSESEQAALVQGRPDFVIDAIDHVESKVDLLRFCYTHGIRVISSMGAGCKSDPSRIRLTDISCSTEDALARVVRHHLRTGLVSSAQHRGLDSTVPGSSGEADPQTTAPQRYRHAGIFMGIPTVYSTEKSTPDKAQLLPLNIPESLRETDGKGSRQEIRHHAAELSVLPNFRARVLPVLGTLPAIFGLTIANYILLVLAEYPLDASMRLAIHQSQDSSGDDSTAHHEHDMTTRVAPSTLTREAGDRIDKIPHFPHPFTPRITLLRPKLYESVFNHLRAKEQVLARAYLQLSISNHETAQRPVDQSHDNTFLQSGSPAEVFVCGSHSEDVEMINSQIKAVRIPLSINDVGFLIDSVFQGRSIISGLTSRLGLTRWEPPGADVPRCTRLESSSHRASIVNLDFTIPDQCASNLQLQNLVCMTREEIDHHINRVLIPRLSPTAAACYPGTVFDRLNCLWRDVGWLD